MKNNTKERGEMRLNLMNWAEEGAAKDFDFASAGFNPMKFNAEQKAAIKSALIFYARNGAAGAFDGLSRNGKLSADLAI